MRNPISTLFFYFSLLISLTSTTYGVNYYWDSNADTAGFGSATGTWGVDANWNSSETGTTTPTTVDTTAADDLFLGTRSNGLTSGTISVSGSTQTFQTLTYGDDSEPITLSGGALQLAQPFSTIQLNEQANTIATELNGPGSLHIEKSMPLTHTASWLTESATVIFTNAQLADYRSAAAIMNGTALPRLPANPYYFINNGTSATCQFQVFDNLHTKCVKVEFAQSGEGITAKILYAKHIEGDQLGIDFDSNGSTYPIVTSDDAPEIGYGVEQVSLLLTERHYEPFLTGQSTVIFPNTTLAECTTISASMGGRNIASSPFPATVVFFSNNGSTALAQIQCYNSRLMKFVKI